MTTLDLADVAVLPEPDDNVAIVSRTLPAGTQVTMSGRTVTLQHRVMEGHRLVVSPVTTGEALLSWSTPFARALRDLDLGDYVCTPTSLEALQSRRVPELPSEPSAANEPLDPYRLDEAALRFGDQVAPADKPGTFWGYSRQGGIAGTRNHIVLVSTTSRSGPFVVELARRFAAHQGEGFDGVVPVAHTEAGEETAPNNLDFLHAVLAGFLVHPNVGAVLVVDEGPDDVVTGRGLAAYMQRTGYPEIQVPHATFSRHAGFSDDLDEAADIVARWLEPVAAQRRTEQPLTDLRIALQCGGSDAFSGISANPLAGAVGREVIRHGGAAVLAETDELIGAEGYVLRNVRDLETARRFLRTVESFKERASWHGHTAEGNPSGGNVYRGLYNIVLKSVGAARKLDRQLRLDHVIDYGEPLPGPGFTFMDSPGNDLESVAGQVASGCNLVFFTTGNGSITNFPFVPTLKFVTTTTRYELLEHEMDVDAGRYLTGTPMDDLTSEVFDLTVRAASGERTAGEQAGHSQVSIWRDWKQTAPREGVSVTIDGRTSRPLDELPADDRDAMLPGLPLPTPAGKGEPDATLELLEADGRRAPEQLALILPTSICSGQIALRLAGEAADAGWHHGAASRVVALPHTEGCGVTGGASEETFARTMVGYLAHPNVRMALLLEHGCEKTHNDYFRSRLVEAGLDPDRFGWASIQRDGGISAVSDRVREWFEETSASMQAPAVVPGTQGDLSIGMDARGPLAPETTEALARVGRWITAAGGSVVLSSRGSLVEDPAFRAVAFGSADQVQPTLAHGQQPEEAGWHVMRMPTTDWLETATGLGASGVHLVLAHVCGGTVSGQRFVPVVQASADPATASSRARDLDAVLVGDADQQTQQAMGLLAEVASRRHVPRALSTGNIGFQITRGLLGTSM